MRYLWPRTGAGAGLDYISPAPSAAVLEERPRRLAILGSTGSIGRNAIEIIKRRPDFFHLCGLACGKNVELLAAQAAELRPDALAVLEAGDIDRLRALLPPGYAPRISHGPPAYAAMAARAPFVLCAQVGEAGLAAALAAALAGRVICLANKESLVLAGRLLRRVCASSRAVILPVDSEHNAIFQCVAGRGEAIRKIILTASGGPFLGKARAELADVTVDQALRHPNWRMGAKISIDSATLMNKGLELIEAALLYGLPQASIGVLVHPQSIVHSLVELADAAQLAQLAVPDMRLPIGNCIFFPEHRAEIAPLNLADTGALQFMEPDDDAFPCLGLARLALDAPAPGLLSPACIALNAANEAAVEIFLRGKSSFLRIPELIKAALAKFSDAPSPELPETGPLPAAEQDAARLALLLSGSLGDFSAEVRKFVLNLAAS